MEASERHSQDSQLALEGDPREGSVRAIDDRLVIESLTVADPRAAHLVRERAGGGVPAAETVRKLIAIGARILDAEGTTVNVDYVKREVQSSLGEIQDELAKTLAAGNTELAEKIAEAFGADRSDSVQRQIQTMLEQSTAKQRLELTTLLSAEDATNPLVAVQARMGKTIVDSDERHRKEMELLRVQHATEARAMQKHVSDLREQLARLLEVQQADQRVAEAEEAGTRKGFSFEESVHRAIERIADGRGDAATHTGATANESGSKKGDSVVDIGAADGPCVGRLVFEAKDSKLSKNEAWRELNAALTERGADFAVLVVAGEDKVPAGREQLHEYEGNKLIIALDREDPDTRALEYAYRYVRARALMAGEASLTVDAAGVRAASEAARTQLKELQKARRSLTAIKNGARDVGDVVESLDVKISEQLDRIESLIAVADSDADAAD